MQLKLSSLNLVPKAGLAAYALSRVIRRNQRAPTLDAAPSGRMIGKPLFFTQGSEIIYPSRGMFFAIEKESSPPPW